MATPTTPKQVSKETQETVVEFLQNALAGYFLTHNVRYQLYQRDLNYYRTADITKDTVKSKIANEQGDLTKLQNITVPVTMPQVDSRLAYLQEVFLSGHPIFGVVAPPGQEGAIKQMEALIQDNSIKSAWSAELTKCMRDGLKYDLGAVEITWENRKIFNLTTPDINNLAEAQKTESYYAGNFIKRLNPYNLILDTRVSPDKIHTDGELAGYSEMLSSISLHKLIEDLPAAGLMNVEEAFNAGGIGDSNLLDITSAVYMPIINQDALVQPQVNNGFNWFVALGLEDKERGASYMNTYIVTKMYLRLIPKAFGMAGPDSDTVQIWKFIIVNRKTVLYAERQTNAHNLLPIIICKPSNDGFDWQSKSFAQNVEPFQQVSTSLVTSALESQRRKVFDRLLYDPSRVAAKEIEKTSSVARIAVKNTTYGKGLSDAVYQIPYRDDGVAEVLSLAQTVIGMADIANGQNRVQQGQFQKGNKTRKEFETVMGNASNRERLMAQALEDTFFTPMKQVILTNILQYQPPTEIVNPQSGEKVSIKPEDLRAASIVFKLSDGFLPSEKIVGLESLGTLFQLASALPQVAVEYDLMGIALYSLQISGASWVQDFKRSPEQQQQTLATIEQTAKARGDKEPPEQQQPKPTNP